MSTASTNDKIEFLRRQRQTRAYSPEPVSESALAEILEVARWTGSAGNKQRWKLVLVQDSAIKRQIAAIKSDTGWVADAAAVIVVLTEGKTPEALRFDAGRMAERLLLAAQAEGLGAGIIGFGDTESNATLRATLNVPADLWIFAAVVIGHHKEQREPSTSSKGGRKPLGDILVRDRFSA